MEVSTPVAEGGKNAHSPKKRRTSYYRKRGRQGRRTKLTGDLLRAISDILAEVDIFSISHLSQELLTRGHSLSRSTVFRAMETLGLRVDRDRKIWCAGPAGNYTDQEEYERFVNLPRRENPQTVKSSQPQNSTTDADKELYSKNTKTPLRDTSTALQMKHPSVNFLHHEDQMNTTEDLSVGGLHASGKLDYKRWEDGPSTLNADTSQARRHPGTQQTNEANGRNTWQAVRFGQSEYGWRLSQTEGTISEIKTKVELEIDDGIDPTNFTEHAQSIRDQATLLHIDGVADVNRDACGHGQVDMASSMPSWDSKRRGRKRKSDCPAKFASFHISELRSVDTSNFPSTASTSGHAGGQLKDQQNSYSRHNDLQPRETVGPDERKADREASISSLPDKTRSGPARRVPRQSSSEDSLILEPEACVKWTEVISETDPQNGSKAQSTRLKRARISCSELLSQERATVDHNLKRKTVMDEDLLHKTGQQNRQGLESTSARVLPDRRREVVHGDTGHQLKQSTVAVKGRPHLNFDVTGLCSSRGSNGQLNYDVKRSGTNTNLQSLPEQHLVRHPQQAGQLPSGDNETSVSFSNPRLQRNSLEHNRHSETDPQTARLHALTSSLVARTSTKVQGTSLVSGRETARSSKDGGNLDSPVNSTPVYQDSSHPSANKSRASDNVNHGRGFNVHEEAQARAFNQRAFSQRALIRRSLPVNIDGRKYPSHPSGVSTQSKNKILDRDSTPTLSMEALCCSMHLPEFQHWMQDVSLKLASLEQQLQYLTQIITQTSGTKEEPEQELEKMPSAETENTNGLEDSGDESEGLEEEDLGNTVEEEEEIQTWGTYYPPVNTPESNDLINLLVADGRWSTLSPYVGGPRLAIRLARECIFGPKTLSRSTVTGRNHMKPLQRDGIMKIKECLMQQYGPKCSDVECKILWKMARESLSQLCKRTRRQFAEGGNGQEEGDEDER